MGESIDTSPFEKASQGADYNRAHNAAFSRCGGNPDMVLYLRTIRTKQKQGDPPPEIVLTEVDINSEESAGEPLRAIRLRIIRALEFEMGPLSVTDRWDLLQKRGLRNLNVMNHIDLQGSSIDAAVSVVTNVMDSPQWSLSFLYQMSRKNPTILNGFEGPDGISLVDIVSNAYSVFEDELSKE